MIAWVARGYAYPITLTFPPKAYPIALTFSPKAYPITLTLAFFRVMLDTYEGDYTSI